MRGVAADLRAANSTFETINAAATAIAAAENRLHQDTIQKRRWGAWWRLYWCFGSMKNKKRIGHGVLLQDASSPEATMASAENPTQTHAILLPFIAPPSSPASFFLSEPPSAAHSPTGLVSFTSVSANMYSPEGPASIFAIGPYAHEKQLVSPPVFSAFTTEPSTAPITPPPESVHLTTPSSPEVPFAQLLDSKIRNGESTQQYPFPHHEFQSYQFYPGSPVSLLISPSSGISGSGPSSPFPDGEFGTVFPQFTTTDPPKLLTLEKLSTRVWGSRHVSGSLTPEVRTSPSKGISNPDSVDGREKTGIVTNGGNRNNEIAVVHRVSFELAAEEFVKYIEKKPLKLTKAQEAHVKEKSMGNQQDEISKRANDYKDRAGLASHDVPKVSKVELEAANDELLSVTPVCVKEFNFDNADGGASLEPDIKSKWWINDRLAGNEGSSRGNWSFFPMMQTNASWQLEKPHHGEIRRAAAVSPKTIIHG